MSESIRERQKFLEHLSGHGRTLVSTKGAYVWINREADSYSRKARRVDRNTEGQRS